MKHILSILISFFFISVSTYAEQYDTDFPGGLNSTISGVTTGGMWKENNTYGTWRLVARSLGWEHTRSYLYLQWLIIDDTNKKVSEYRTIPIQEFNDSNWHHVRNIKYKDQSFIINYTIRGEKAENVATIQPGLHGKYKIKLKD